MTCFLTTKPGGRGHLRLRIFPFCLVAAPEVPLVWLVVPSLLRSALPTVQPTTNSRIRAYAHGPRQTGELILSQQCRDVAASAGRGRTRRWRSPSPPNSGLPKQAVADIGYLDIGYPYRNQKSEFFSRDWSMASQAGSGFSEGWAFSHDWKAISSDGHVACSPLRTLSGRLAKVLLDITLFRN